MSRKKQLKGSLGLNVEFDHLQEGYLIEHAMNTCVLSYSLHIVENAHMYIEPKHFKDIKYSICTGLVNACILKI